MSIVLHNCESFALAYLDDIIIFSSNLEDHEKHIQQVFDCVRQHNLKLKLPKCEFLQKQTQYLGFIISEDGIMANPGKVKVIKEMPPPTNVHEVRSFIGMCSYYRRFLPNFSQIAMPLIKLTKKYAKFDWSPECQIAFDFLKESLTTVPVLAYPDTNKPYILYTDASEECIGACLCQAHDEGDNTDDETPKERPIYFLSHKLSPTQTQWPPIESEAYAIFYALEKLNQYLHDVHLVIRTDYKPLKDLFESPIQNKKIQYWTTNLRGYNCKVEYTEGKKNVCADMLSRLPHKEQDSCNESEVSGPDTTDKTFKINMINSNNLRTKDFAQFSSPLGDDQPNREELNVPHYDMVIEQAKDKVLLNLKEEIQSSKASSSVLSKHIILDDILYFIPKADTDPIIRLYLPRHIIKPVIMGYHDNNGHVVIDKTHDAIKHKYYWPNMYKELYDYINNCITCQTRNLTKVKPPQQETNAPPYPFA